MEEIVRIIYQTDYNKFSEEKANAEYMWLHAKKDKYKASYYEDIWDLCVDEMYRLEDRAYYEGYEFVSVGTRVKNNIQSDIYRLVKIDR